MTRVRGLAFSGLPTALCVIGLLMALWPTLISLGHRLPGDPGDVRFCQYLMEHSLLWLERAPAHLKFWDVPFFYPHPNVLAYSETLFGVAPFYWMGRWIGFGPNAAMA